jgi:Tfp pilus assembly protein PilN
MKQINLLPQTEARELKLTMASKQLLKFFALIAACLVLFGIAAFISRLFVQASITENQIQIDELQKKLSSSDNKKVEKEVVALNTQIHNLRAINQQHYYWSYALVELANLAPNSFHLDSVTFDRTTNQVVVVGTSDSRADVINFWAKVKKSNLFTNINFPLPNLEKPTESPFTFTFYVNPEAITKQ